MYDLLSVACGQGQQLIDICNLDMGQDASTQFLTWLLLLYTHSDHWEELRYPHSKAHNKGINCDIWGGDILREETKKGRFFSHQEHLAFSLSTDGVPLFKSSSMCLWPVYLIPSTTNPHEFQQCHPVCTLVWFTQASY